MEFCEEDQSETVFVCEKCDLQVIVAADLFAHYKICGKLRSDAGARKLLHDNIVRQALGIPTKSKPTSSSVITVGPAHRKRKSGDLVKSISSGDPLPNIKKKKVSTKLPKAIQIKDTSSKRGKPFQCEQCNCSYLSRRTLKVHVRRIHEQQKNFKCEKCNRSFFGKNEIDQHMLSHTQSGEFVCQLCPSNPTFKRQWNLNDHKKRFHNNGEKSYTCHHEGCRKTFETKNNLSAHARTHNRVNYQCPVCEREFRNNAGVVVHIATKHNEGETSYECEDCPITGHKFVTNRSGSLRSHIMQCHTADQKYACHYCGRGFKQPGSLQRHINGVHENPSSHHCELCPRSLSSKQMLQKHVKRHSNKNFSCFICQVDFESQEKLIDHSLSNDHREKWGSERKSRPIEKESEYSPHLKLVLAGDPEKRLKKTCPTKDCVICLKGLAVYAVYYQDTFIPLSDQDIFDCDCTDTIYLLVCVNPNCCPQLEPTQLFMYRYCGQTKNFRARMDQHFLQNPTRPKHNVFFDAHFNKRTGEKVGGRDITCGEKWFRIIPVAKCLPLQSSRNFLEIDIISALKCCDVFSGGLNRQEGGQYNYTKVRA